MIGEQFSVGYDPAPHSSYVSSWIEIIQKDPKEIFRASYAAEKIKTFIIEFETVKVIDVEKSHFLR
ncbi:hypothetical protein Bcsk_002690 [Bartonella sp. CDC_skunk]|uniref:hypothetical protein n=1 Tax=Bartonella sp. CDC_skunk TaxID=1933905 RepID=UPI0009C2175A|nr:hypothetical protein [Bartonella sp. CDC_skunk]AQX20929.1 hypothetical protein Bcsk_002690 [Bartonella sp. CDC_skunk]